MSCIHKNNEVIYWERASFPGKQPFIGVQYKCNDCGEYYQRTIRSEFGCQNFIEKYADKEKINGLQ